MLIKAKQWAIENFADGSIPAHATIAKWIKKGVIEGQIIDGAAYVERHTKIRSQDQKTPGKKEVIVGNRRFAMPD